MFDAEDLPTGVWDESCGPICVPPFDAEAEAQQAAGVAAEEAHLASPRYANSDADFEEHARTEAEYWEEMRRRDAERGPTASEWEAYVQRCAVPLSCACGWEGTTAEAPIHSDPDDDEDVAGCPVCGAYLPVWLCDDREPNNL